MKRFLFFTVIYLTVTICYATFHNFCKATEIGLYTSQVVSALLATYLSDTRIITSLECIVIYAVISTVTILFFWNDYHGVSYVYYFAICYVAAFVTRIVFCSRRMAGN